MKIINSRRHFIKAMGSSLLGGAALSNGLMPLLANAQVSSSDNYKALVCINLSGGNDAFNTVVPMKNSVYASYSDIRRELALPRESLIALNNADQNYDAYGFHPALLESGKLFNEGKLAVVGNVGNLLEPASKTDYLQKKIRIPANLFSHNDQAILSQTLNDGAVTTGWAGRIAEAMGQFNINQQLAMNITLSGDNFLQRGSIKSPFSMKKDGVNLIEAVSSKSAQAYYTDRANLYREFLAKNRSHLLQQYYSDVQMNAWIMSRYVSDILSAQPVHEFPSLAVKTSTGLTDRLAMAAKIIAANDAFEVKRQIFNINLGSFDTHADQLNGQRGLLAELNTGLAGFYDALSTLGYADKVTVFTLSEFGRTLSRNGADGTDHGWGSHHIVMGGAVKGQKIWGSMPAMELGGADDIGEGRIIPSLSFDQYAATLGKWFGLNDDDLLAVFPNLKNFNQRNLGFMV